MAQEVCGEGAKRQVVLFPKDALPLGDATVVGVLERTTTEAHAAMGGRAGWLHALAAVGSGCILVSPPACFTQRHPLGQVLQILMRIGLSIRARNGLHRDWFTANAMTDLLEVDFALVGKDTLYRCLDKLLPHSRH